MDEFRTFSWCGLEASWGEHAPQILWLGDESRAAEATEPLRANVHCACAWASGFV